jgi:transporter family protein
VTWWSFALILTSLVTFVAGQLLLKKGMELTAHAVRVRRRYLTFLIAGTVAMAISFFLTLGLLQRFDLSYLYPFQGLSVVLIAITAAISLREKLTAQLLIGALLISAGILLVSVS